MSPCDSHSRVAAVQSAIQLFSDRKRLGGLLIQAQRRIERNPLPAVIKPKKCCVSSRCCVVNLHSLKQDDEDRFSARGGCCCGSLSPRTCLRTRVVSPALRYFETIVQHYFPALACLGWQVAFARGALQ